MVIDQKQKLYTISNYNYDKTDKMQKNQNNDNRENQSKQYSKIN